MPSQLIQAIYLILSYGEVEVEEMEDTLQFDGGFLLTDIRNALAWERRDGGLVLTPEGRYARFGFDEEFGHNEWNEHA